MTTQQASLIAYDLTDAPRAVVVEILIHKIVDPEDAHQLNQQLHMLLRPDMPSRFILDFQGVTILSSTAFGALAAFALDVRKQQGCVFICNMNDIVRFGAEILHLPDLAQFVESRQAALHAMSAQEIPWSNTKGSA
jgi:anti-anti-sigma factor